MEELNTIDTRIDDINCKLNRSLEKHQYHIRKVVSEAKFKNTSY